MAEQEHYSLRWNNHQNHILRAFDTLLQSKTLVDVTLVCSDTSIFAHKVVLSACSPFFERIFAETPCKHPVIVLKDFNGSTIRTIVGFMYRGHISVRQEKLKALMQAGQSLQVRGLVDHPMSENTPTPVQSPDDFMAEPSIISSPCSPALSTFDEHPSMIQTSSSKLLCANRHVFVDRSMTNNNSSTEVPETCTSPMPRRKQARPRRRSGECGPYDLTRKSSTPAPASVNDNDVDLVEDVAKAGKEKEKELDDEERPESSLDDEIENLNLNETEHDNDNDNDNENDNDQELPEQEHEHEQEQDADQEDPEHENDMDERNEDIDSSEVPENLCTKNALNNNSESLNNNNNNRIVLSLKDIRHLNRSSYRPHPFGGGPPNHSDFSHPKNHSASSLVQSENMKREAIEGRLDGDNPFLDQMDLTLAAHHHNMQMQNARHEMENNMHKEYTPSSPMSLPSHFNPRDGLPHPPSPLQFPGMPSALTLTPPHHMFGLDSPLLFPPGMDPAKIYNPLMEMSDPRGMHPDHHGPFLKKKMTRPKGQHSAPRGGPPRSWTNAELTEALQHVWNKKMTTSQASRIFGIPYNSLLMYVRGKYGKSLKLEQLRKDCISGPPIELLTMGMGSHNNNNKMDRNKELKELDGGPLQRSSSSEPDLLSSPNAMFNPFPPGFYPDFAAGFPGLPLSMLNLLPPDRHPPSMHMPMDEDCKSDRSKQSLEDDFPQPLTLTRDERREILQQNGQD